MLTMCFLPAGQACKYQEWWHHRRQPKANPGIDLDNHFALSGECFHDMIVHLMFMSYSDTTTETEWLWYQKASYYSVILK